jgi:two-component system response regulator CpxR
MPDKFRILLIDDDRKLTRLLTELLTSAGFDVDAVHDGDAGLQHAKAGGWHLIVLDVMLPAIDGLSLLRHLRVLSTVPVLMLTGRGGENDRIAGLESGADDYLPKTSSARELLARIRAILRRSAPDASKAAATIQHGSLQINLTAREVRIASRTVELTAVEFDLLLALVRRPGEICTREVLLEEVNDREFSGTERSIDMHITALRRKLGDDPRAPSFIRTVRSAGYLFIQQPAA